MGVNLIKNLPIGKPIELLPLTPSGSERKFFRLRDKQARTLIRMSYTSERKENEFYCNIALFLGGLGIRVPRIYYYQPGEIYLEDLGDLDLCSLGGEEKYYYQVIDQLLILHKQTKLPFESAPAFDYFLYRWETGYFLDNLVNSYYGLKLEENLQKEVEDDFHFLAEVLAKEENVLIHRDCQSKNVLIKNGQAYFIDFQGMRLGLPQYDLASLLEDPYVNLNVDLKKDLFNHYCNSYPGDAERFAAIYNYCALQRLMQALGAYGFLGLKKDLPQYLKYIPNAVNRLRLQLDCLNGFAGLNRLCHLIDIVSKVT